uniref:Uncharacterized protein n=1 Tax=Alexandrium monilatum TaxID=311494 RepID=A0A7S4UC93_9DINO
MAYTTEQVDELIRTLEKGAERQIATAHSAVKGVAAERDLLSSAESARDLLVKAVKGEKETLNSVFGAGDCEKIGRLRYLLDTVQLSDMHVKDQRWKHLREAVDTIEQVLKDLGTFKPWVPPTVQAPERLAYKGLRRRLSPGRRMNLKPEMDGGDGATFEVSPPLPAALELSAATGAITGRLQPGQLIDEATYVVTARNEAGETSVELVFSVKDTPPASLAYPNVRAEILAGEKVRWEPAIEGGLPTSWSVEPALPSGLVLDGTTGVIQGAVPGGVEVMVYKVAAANSGGQAEASVEFGVRAAAPRSPVYPCPEEGAVYALGGSLELVPEVTPGCTFSISPQLPAGLRIDEDTGVISGTPSEPTARTAYEVRARNAGGEARATISFEVRQMPPSSLAYPEMTERLYAGYAVSLAPEVEGAPSSWTVEPTLPAGLSLDAATGAISGAPSEVVASGTWTVTASNPAGETSCELKFSVDVAPPSTLSFPAVEQEMALLVPMTLTPSVQGQVEEYSVFPDLPAGLRLDPQTGVISGSPTEVAGEATYEVTAKNSSGSSTVALTFAVKRTPPKSLKYPLLSPQLMVGRAVEAMPDVSGSVQKFSVQPPLPAGLEIDEEDGTITGSPETEAAEAKYVVTASNEAGETSEEITFAVLLPPPSDLSYPLASSTYAVGGPVLIEPEIKTAHGCSYSVEPPLPEGIELDPKTGVVSGEPAATCDEATYNITARNSAGSSEAQLVFQVVETLDSDQVAGSINKDFAAKIEAVEDIAELLPEPSKTHQYGDWMIWMVHRAHLNDPSLVDFNFNNMHMPEPHIESRIAPKLMKAMETNTYIKTLSLVNSNLMKVQGMELATALQENKTLQILNLDSNNLDSLAVQKIASAIRENKGSKLEHLRLAQQKGQGGISFGRPTEEAIGLLMEKNESIIKLGFECNDAHWRNIIDRALLRNNDFARKKRRRSTLSPEEEVVPEEKALSRLVLQQPPSVSVSEVFNEDAHPNNVVFRSFVSNQKRLPTMSQLQNYARNSGTSLKYSTVAPLIKECRSRLLDAAVNKEVIVADIFEVDSAGDLRNWSENNGNWALDIWSPDGKRYAYKTNKEPAFLVSDAWAAWLQDGA